VPLVLELVPLVLVLVPLVLVLVPLVLVLEQQEQALEQLEKVLSQCSYKMQFFESYHHMLEEVCFESLNCQYINNILLVLLVIYIFDLLHQVVL
jgi:hypothetical protein